MQKKSIEHKGIAPDPEAIYQSVQHLPWPCLLDSCQPLSSQGRYDIISADPYIKLLYKGGQCEIIHRDGREKIFANPFDILKQYMKEEPPSTLPFTGGAIGFFSYDLGQYLEKLPNQSKNDTHFNEMMVGIYDWAIVIDHKENKIDYLCCGHDPHPTITYDNIEQLLLEKKVGDGRFTLNGQWECNMTYEEYSEKFNTIKKYIHAGDCYQVNLTQRFKNSYSGDLWQAYKQLRKRNFAHYGAFLSFDEFCIMSCSPEQFLTAIDKEIRTKPMKGTRPRHADPKIDKELANELYHSEKDRAENLMIVDLLRNDLGKCCVPGSIKVPELFAIESFPGVHQMVTPVRGVLNKKQKAVDLLKACFPGGSITGAPKIRAMEIIDELEPYKRSVYCGAIGYISNNGNMDTSIAIRTLYADNEFIYLSVGGAIVADSEVNSEYEECFTKINKIFEVLSD